MAAHIWADGKPRPCAAGWRRTAAKRTRHRASSATDTIGRLSRSGSERSSWSFLSGMLPVVGHKPQFIGRVGGKLSLEDGRKAATTATLNALSAAKELLGSLDHVTSCRQARRLYRDRRRIPGTPEGRGRERPNFWRAVFGADKLSSRVVLGVASLPLGVPIELELVVEVAPGNLNRASQAPRRRHSGIVPARPDPTAKGTADVSFRHGDSGQVSPHNDEVKPPLAAP